MTIAPAPAAAPPTSDTVAAINPSPDPVPVPQHNDASRTTRDQLLDAAEAALRRGDYASAVEKLEPLALAGVAKSQTMLGRAYEGRGGPQASYFQAYIWYSIAARRGDSGAAALKDKVAGKLQPAELAHADRVVVQWKPSADTNADSNR